MQEVDVIPRESDSTMSAQGDSESRTGLSQASHPAVGSRTSPSSARSKRRRERRKRFLWLLLVVSLAILSGGWWWHQQRGQGELDPGAATASAEGRDFSSSVLATGSVRAQVGAEVQVGARISGKVERLLANIGDTVTKGQVLAELEKADLQAVVAQREAELQLAKAKRAAVESLLPKEIQRAEFDMSRWQATRDLYEQELARESRLLASEATSQQSYQQAEERLAVTRSELDSAEQAYELAKARLEEDRKQAAAEVVRARCALDNAEVQLSYATISAPIDGVIALAALSLIVGGVVLMNILLISVAERTPEIGLRRAVGATHRDIFVQFLAESLAVTIFGMALGSLGSLVGLGISVVLPRLTPINAFPSWEPFLLALAFALVVGTFFGVQPARRAARLHPVEALR